MKINQATAIATKVDDGKWITIIALNDQAGGPEGVRILLINERPSEYSSESVAAKTALEVISGLGLENLAGDKFPVMSKDGSVVEEDVTAEFRAHLTKLVFDGGRVWITVGTEDRVWLCGGFVDTKADKAFLWRLSPTNEFQPSTPHDAVVFGMAILNALGLRDIDHGHHVLTFPDRSAVLDDAGNEAVKQ